MTLKRNTRVAARWDELWREGKTWHYETLYRIVSEEVAREREACANIAETWAGDFERDTPGRTEGATRSGIAAAIRNRT